MITKDMISPEALEKYKVIYRSKFGKDISDQEALDQAIKLLTLVDIVYRPVKKEWVKDLEEEDKNGRI